MKSFNTGRRGSALLIVLGILSFMIVSAVAFSVLMRQSRLPSSFLRQKVAAAQLTKAALASAMAEIDRAIGDNPYPGVGNSNGTDDYGNWWRNRILMLSKSACDATPDADGGGEVEGAVSTMPMEGLAYVPPPLLTTVRYWMKRSPTSVWQTLGYDAGRYAYTAVNVSDYLDINRLKADVMRDSSPSNRISLAFLFENDDHTGDGEVSPSSFDTAMKKTRQGTYSTRLVSMADYALSVFSGDLSGSGFTSPFCDYVDAGGGNGIMYSGADTDNAGRQKFMTDSWYPGSLTNETVAALTDSDAQPFASGFPTGIDALMQNGSSGLRRFQDNLTLPEMVALKDYLDEDNVPTSLAMPTLERTPMLVGLQIEADADSFTPTFVEGAKQTENVPTADGLATEKTITHRIWNLKEFKNGMSIKVGGSAVFPFKRTSGIDDATSWKMQVIVKAYLVPDGQQTDETRLKGGFTCRPTDTADWNAKNLLGGDAACLVFQGTLNGTVKSSRKDESDTYVDFMPEELKSDAPTTEYPVYAVKVTQNFHISPSSGGSNLTIEYDNDRMNTEVGSKRLNYYQKIGEGSAATDRVNLMDTQKAANIDSELSLRWQFFAYARILDEGGNTVDLFPACLKDDTLYNKVDQSALVGAGSTSSLGEPTREAVVPIKGPIAFVLKKDTFVDPEDPLKSPVGFETGGFSKDGAEESLCIYCDDPRYNWAPEDWFRVEASAVNAATWLEKAKGRLNGNDCRPHDIFQFVSNQGYLQSMGEIQFLPLVRTSWNDYTIGNGINNSFCNSISRYNGNPFSSRSSGSDCANSSRAWKLYDFCGNGTWGDDDTDLDPYSWNGGIVDARGGAVVSQYADEDLFMAAIANTPYDYIVASEPEDPGTPKFGSLSEGRKYCFSPASDEAKIDWETLEDVAAQLRSELQSGVEWRDLSAWRETGSTLFGKSVDSFHDVDRKFLQSYWRNCIGNEQQLFLVFVRAEPTVMGAASSGHTPAQLGGRAVALVWREPTSTIGDTPPAGESSPHRMRILFYHQFE